MGNDSRIIITFDEFFKSSSKSFFEKQGFRVETEVEIFKLPKRLDVLVVKNPHKTLPDEFTLFRYWKEYNLLSFKSEKDIVRISDIWDCFIYFYGFLNLSPVDNFDNTTISLLVNHHPGKFLKKFSKFCKELDAGVWEIDSNFCKIYLIELHKINLSGLDRFYLRNFSTDKSFLELVTKTEAIEKGTKEAKWIDSIQNFIQDRITAFEKERENLTITSNNISSQNVLNMMARKPKKIVIIMDEDELPPNPNANLKALKDNRDDAKVDYNSIVSDPNNDLSDERNMDQ
ncbi:MAG: hypothetical protein EBS19_09335, partial [Spirochaetia bacterium]|nr:hypothetical protein [Spirochaetia bacterium]